MKLYLVKKAPGRIYRSDDIIQFIGNLEGWNGLLLKHNELGAPRLVRDVDTLSAEAAPLPFLSITDTNHYWAAAVADTPVGLDMEEKDRKLKPALVKAFHPLEQQYLAGLEAGSSEWAREVLEIWTRKEAYMKLCPEALRRGMRSFSVISEDLGYRKGLPLISKSQDKAAAHDDEAEMKTLDSKRLTEACRSAEIAADPEGSPLFASFKSISLAEPLIMTLCSVSDEEAELVRPAYGGAHGMTALEKAAQLLGERAFSKAGLEKKLIERGYDKAEAADATSTLQARGYLNDAQLAIDLIGRAQAAGQGKLRIMRELSLRGIPRETAETAWEEVSAEAAAARSAAGVAGGAAGAESELERALAAAGRLIAEKTPDDKLKAKVARKLNSLGYDAHTIWTVLDRLS